MNTKEDLCESFKKMEIAKPQENGGGPETGPEISVFNLLGEASDDTDIKMTNCAELTVTPVQGGEVTSAVDISIAALKEGNTPSNTTLTAKEATPEEEAEPKEEEEEPKKEEAGLQESVEKGVSYSVYRDEEYLEDIMRLISKDLSEPYSIYTYRYFIHNWPTHCYIAHKDDKLVGVIVCKLELHNDATRRGYIAMLAIDNTCRRLGIGSHLVMKSIKSMVDKGCDEVVLEAEITNSAALDLYHNLGFVFDKRLFRYYLNGVEAIRLKLWLT